MADFQQRMHQASQDVYARIQTGDLAPGDVEAALLDAQLEASEEDDD